MACKCSKGGHNIKNKELKIVTEREQPLGMWAYMIIVRGGWGVVNVKRGGLHTYPSIEISTDDGHELGLHVIKHPF
jgi:hypothetical protein